MIWPNKNLLKKTNAVDYYYWNYIFPIKYVQRYRFTRIIKLLGNKYYNRLLEIGIGSGIFLPELSKHSKELHGCDIHGNYSSALKICKYYHLKSVFIRKQNIEKTDYESDFFDVIVGVSVLEFVSNLSDAILEIKRILKKEGIFITVCPMENKFLDLILSIYSSRRPKDEFGNSRKVVSKMLEENFKIIHKSFFTPIIGRFFPVYTFYLLQNKK